nr:MAG TPA: hypothetical protein [Caudoviricetes sp.]
MAWVCDFRPSRLILRFWRYQLNGYYKRCGAVIHGYICMPPFKRIRQPLVVLSLQRQQRVELPR